ncbi:hypothetical protein [Megalodesulfovibrio gigas]|uniref:Uncharacterized protein n=1 Tax=Megalodesulfovibrio gigas (strain ATCC 19364 / DSM 1382 / NCIMB 9332 / VKM B-1759) TaxID=1121448 RepID=T2G7J3_MEGG1|nr:hypothetical protein [Megalodesulfovibrio gigas]AGW12091.1 hypothetical protein DGI_0154 [Megalodesulfovibrio gigas DSM 1382 = ATCC 19364]
METGTRIRSAVSGGDVIATRTAVQPTATGDARVVQLVDFASRQLADWQRVLRSAVEAADAAALDAVSLAQVEAGTATAWFDDSLIFVGDCDRLVVTATHSAADGVAVVTPVILHYDGLEWVTPVGLLESKACDATTLRDASGKYLAPLLAWDTCGAHALALHVTSIGGTGNALTLAGGALAEVEA